MNAPCKSHSRYLCLFAACAAALYAACGAATAPTAQTAEGADAEARLTQVRSRIAALTRRLGDELQERDALNARLREMDLSITAKRRRLDTLRTAVLDAERRRRELRAAQARDQSALAAERAALAAQARAAYMIGPQERIKLLLNQSDPAGAGRMLTLYGYFARERGARIEGIRDRVARLQGLVGEIEQTTSTLQALQSDATQEMTALAHARRERAQALQAVAQQLSSGTRELSQLRREEQAVEDLVADLSRVLKDFPLDAQQSFAGLRGRLPWPVPGRMTARYQETRVNAAGSGVRWNGVLIETARGAKVRAPCGGRVVYADWLQGLGLLLIIAHTGNYMTLYGHAEVLYKSVGDWVAPGDVVAALSDSQGAAPQLYFEIREGRKTVDPKSWLRAAP